MTNCRLTTDSNQESYCIPGMNGFIASLGDAAIFSTINANDGYREVNVGDEDCKKTAFATPRTLFRFIQMSFCRGAPPWTILRVMDIILSSVR